MCWSLVARLEKIGKNIFMNNFGPLRLAWVQKEVQKRGIVCPIRIEIDQDVTISFFFVLRTAFR